MPSYPDLFFSSTSASSSTASSTLTTPVDLDEATFSFGSTGVGDYFDFASLEANDGVNFLPSSFDAGGSIFSLSNSSFFDHIPSSFVGSSNMIFDFDPSSNKTNVSASSLPSSSNLPSFSFLSNITTAPLPLRGRKRTLSQSEDGSQSTVRSLSPLAGPRRGKKDKKEDEEFGGSDGGGSLDGDEYAGGEGKGGVNTSKAERRKATNRASAKAFRARRKSLLSDLQVKISERDEEIDNLHSLITKLKDQKENLLSRRKNSSSSVGSG